MYKRSLALLMMAMLFLSITGCKKTQSTQNETMPLHEATKATEVLETTVVSGESGITNELVNDENAQINSSDMDVDISDLLEKDSSVENEAINPTECTTSKETEAVDSTEIAESTTPTVSTNPTEPDTSMSVLKDPVTEYDNYMNMSAEEQQAFIESFPSLEAFMAWFNQAQAEHNANDDSIEIDSGVIDLEEFSKNGK